ncbi:MAG: hypothetical protein H6Q74_3062 [Firmicutes bacterium]|nr:hypothetical protein [Bacillota bacterium]
MDLLYSTIKEKFTKLDLGNLAPDSLVAIVQKQNTMIKRSALNL